MNRTHREVPEGVACVWRVMRFIHLAYFLKPAKAKRKSSRIRELRPKGLPEGVQRYAERQSLRIAKGILIKICAINFHLRKHKGIGKNPMPFAISMILSSF